LAVHGLLAADNGRDLAIAWRIAQAHDLPLRGPFQSGGVHLGPLYPYLSAIPVGLFGTAMSLILFISLLGLASLYFGYKLGDLLFGREVGLAFAALLGGDFMATINSVGGGNTALIISSCLLYLYMTCSAILRREARPLCWALVAAAVMLQMHLATAALLPLVAIALFLPMNGKKTRDVVIGLSLAFALFLPYLIHQVAHGWDDVRALWRFFQSDTSAALHTIPFASLPRLFLRYNQFSASMAAGMSEFVTPWWSRLPVIACLRLSALGSLLGLVVTVLALLRGDRRAPHGLVLAWLILGWSVIPLLRPSLPWYVLLPVYPAHLLLASLAMARLAGAAGRLGVWRLVPYGVAGGVFLLSPLLMAQTFSRFAEQGRLQVAAWLMKDLHHEATETSGRFIIPYLGARREEQMVRHLANLPEADTSLYRRIHGVPLWSTIFTRAALFQLHPLRAPSGEPSPRHLVGLLQGDLPGRPIGQLTVTGPLLLVTSLPSLAYEGVRYSFTESERWFEPDYNDSGWRRVDLPNYTVPIPWEYPPRPSAHWEQRPVYFRTSLVHQAASPTFLGISFPTFGAPEEHGEVKRLFLNGLEVGSPSLRSPYLLLYDITPYLRLGENNLALAVGGGANFILDLFTVSVKP
jgi:hypothetical protein